VRRVLTLSLALGALLAVGSAHAQTPTERARQILREPAYPFCHDSNRYVRPQELRYCGYVDARSACPEFAQACDRMRTFEPSCSPPRDVGKYARPTRQILLLSLLTVVAFLSVLFVRAMARARREQKLVDRPAAAPATTELIPLPLATAGELFARALEAHRRGEHGAALYALYGALLRRLDERGVIRLDPAATPGDYLRQCRETEIQGPLRATTREVERVRFGGLAPTAEAFERLRPLVEPIVRTVTALVLMVALAAGTAGCGGLAGGFGGGGETSPAGHRAVRALLNSSGVSARRLREAPERVQDVDRVLVLDAAATPLDEDQWSAVLAWVDRGGRLLLAGGSASWPGSLGVSTLNSGFNGSVVRLADTVGGETVRVPGGSRALDAGEAGYSVASYASSGGAYAVWSVRNRGTVLLLAEPELLTNGGIAVGDNASAAVSLVRALAEHRPVYFVEDTVGAASNPLRSMERTGLLPVLLQGLLALTLFYLSVGRHFGTPRERTEVSRRAFTEHVRAVGALYARARASQAALRQYAALVLERIRERSGTGRTLRSEVIAARLGEQPAEVERVLHSLEQAQSASAPSVREEEHLALIKRLNEWYRKL
jgi:hypothetical protein